MAFVTSNRGELVQYSQKVITSCSANSLLALSSILTMINSDTLIEHMQAQPVSGLLYGYISSSI